MTCINARALSRPALLATAFAALTISQAAHALGETLPATAPTYPAPTMVTEIVSPSAGLSNWDINSWNSDGKNYGGTVLNGSSATSPATFTPGPDVTRDTLYAYYIRALPAGALKPNKRYRLEVSARTCSGCTTDFQISLTSENKALDSGGNVIANSGYRSHEFARTFSLNGTTVISKQIDGFFTRQGVLKPQDFYVRIRPLKANTPFYLTGLRLVEMSSSTVPNPATDLGFGQPSASTPPTLNRDMFGIHVNRLGTHNTWSLVGQNAVRTWGYVELMWNEIQKTENSAIDFALPYYFIDRLREGNASATFIYTLGQTPAWAAEQPATGCSYQMGCAAPRLDAWRQYVRAMAAGLKTRVKYFELWNEPYTGNFFQAAGAKAPRHLRDMACIAKEELAGTGIQLIGPNLLPDTFSDEFLKAGGGDCVDILSMHAYFTPFTIENDLPRRIANIKFLVKEHGLQGKPLWLTEGAAHCLPDPSKPTENLCRNLDVFGSTTRTPTDAELKGALPRAVASMWASGIRNFDYFFQEGGFDSWSGLTAVPPPNDPCRFDAANNYCRSLMPSTSLGKGYAWASNYFNNGQLQAAYTNQAGDVHIYQYLNNNGYTRRVIWNTGSSIKQVVLPTGWGVTKTTNLDGLTSTYGTQKICTKSILGLCVQTTTVGADLALKPLEPVFLE